MPDEISEVKIDVTAEKVVSSVLPARDKLSRNVGVGPALWTTVNACVEEGEGSVPGNICVSVSVIGQMVAGHVELEIEVVLNVKNEVPVERARRRTNVPTEG